MPLMSRLPSSSTPTYRSIIGKSGKKAVLPSPSA